MNIFLTIKQPQVIMKLIVMALFIFLFFFSCTRKDLYVVDNGSTEYVISVSVDADSIDRKAARELQKYLEMISGVRLSIVTEEVSSTNSRILVGKTIGSQTLSIQPDEIIITETGRDIYIAGGDSKSTLYAVYTFLEHYLDCRFYTPDVEFIPRSGHIAIPQKLNYRYTPPITIRTVHSRLYYENHDFANKRKTTYEAFPRYVPGAGVHTFHRFVPAEKYLKKNPEYFALRNGRRISAQLCLTHPEVLEIVIDVVDSLLWQYPESDVISVSQDDNQQYCECTNCMAINDREGTPAGSVIDFVNKVAAKFPDKMISTLAYQYTRTAPKNIKPGGNVLITLCSIECDRSAPIEEKCVDFAEDLIAWGKLTDNIRIWDYTTQFTNFLAPFPNIHTLQPNIQLFRANNAKWVFEQHSHQPSELFELRSYLTAKLLWNPDVDQDSIISDFLNGYYEEAAPFIQKYISTVHEELRKDSDFFLFLYGDPSQGFKSFLRPEMLRRYDQWFEEASESVKRKPDVLKRVNRARLSIDYAILEAARKNDPASFTLVTASEDGKKNVPEILQQRLNRFRQTCQESDITYMNETRFMVDEYLEFYDYSLNRAKEENIARGMKVELLQSPLKYADEDPQVLTDGAFGGSSFFANWLGFEGNDLEAIIDMEDEKEISKISCDFLQVVNHVVFFPTDVKYYYSLNGTDFAYLGTANNEDPLTRRSKINDIKGFTIDFSPVMARFIKVEGNNMGEAPMWHHAAGMPCWIFADEIMVR
jgi:hypothetical protein